MEKSGCSCGGGCITEVFLMARFCKFEEKCFLNCITLKLILIDVINKHSGILKTKYWKVLKIKIAILTISTSFEEKIIESKKKLVEKIDGNASLTFQAILNEKFEGSLTISSKKVC